MGQKYAYIDMDVEPETAIHYGVVGVPTLLLIDDETEALIGKLNGAVGQHQIKELLSLANIK
jgi:thioredoxin-like negative regulator of GroEL